MAATLAAGTAHFCAITERDDDGAPAEGFQVSANLPNTT